MNIIDYTEWRKLYFGEASVEALNEVAVCFAQTHPFRLKKPQIAMDNQ